MNFGEITGHEEEKRRLASMADNSRLPHALLLHGPSGIGKTAIACAFVQYLYCTNRRNGDSCGKCPACVQTAALNNPDVHYIYPIIKRTKPSREISSDFSEEWKEMLEKHPYMPVEKWLDILDAGNSRPIIYVSESDEILRLSSLSSYGNAYKVFLVWQPEKMNVEAANKLLKVIEEPFEDTLFIFVSNNPGEIMPTIRSRLQDIEFKPLGDADIKTFLLNEGKSEEEASMLAKIARGNMNRVSMLADKEGETAAFAEDFIAVMRCAYARKMPELKELSDKFASYGREKSLRLLDYFARMIRESFISNLKCNPLKSMTPAEEKFVEKFGPFINEANVEEMSRETNRAREDISRNANQKIVWFDFMLEITKLIRTKGIAAAK